MPFSPLFNMFDATPHWVQLWSQMRKLENDLALVLSSWCHSPQLDIVSSCHMSPEIWWFRHFNGSGNDGSLSWKLVTAFQHNQHCKDILITFDSLLYIMEHRSLWIRFLKCSDMTWKEAYLIVIVLVCHTIGKKTSNQKLLASFRIIKNGIF